MSLSLPRPVAVPTREAHLATLRAWHAERFGPHPELVPPCETIVVVAAADSLMSVDAATGEVIEQQS